MFRYLSHKQRSRFVLVESGTGTLFVLQRGIEEETLTYQVNYVAVSNLMTNCMKILRKDELWQHASFRKSLKALLKLTVPDMSLPRIPNPNLRGKK